MTMCCPFTDDDYDSAKVYDQSIIAARKEHACTECSEPIRKGSRHELVKGLWDGGWSTYRTCLLCVEIRDHFACNGRWLFGQIWEQLQENFYPDMRAGGACMFGLSPEAKAFLIERRMEWYFARDEVNDSRWKDWTPDKPPSERTPYWNARVPAPDEEPDPARGREYLFGDDDDGGGWS